MLKAQTKTNDLVVVGAWFCCGLIIMSSLITFVLYRKELMQWRRLVYKKQERRKTEEEDREPQVMAADQKDTFSPVNRTYDYLREGAVNFARSHNLGDTVKALYEAPADKQPSRTKQSSSKKNGSRNKKTRRSTKREPVLADFSKWDKSKVDPRFIMPIDYDKFWLSSPFGTRKNPDGSRGFHYGIDMAAIHGTPVKAAGDGIVVEAGNQSGYGNVIVIDHGDGFRTRYAHCSKIRTARHKKVFQGDVIADVGSTGNARSSSKNKNKNRSASHLHFEVEVKGKRMNPFYFFLSQ